MSERDLQELLASLEATRRPGRWCMVSGVTLPADVAVAATIVEVEGLTAVISIEDAAALKITMTLPMAWLSLGVVSTLDSVGLTAVVATALAKEGIACNVLAGYYHDHLLVPDERADQALAVLKALADPEPPV
jgi:hypothetical protein